MYRFYGDFYSSSLQLNFCFVRFFGFVFFSFSDSIPLLLIPPPGMAHTAESLCLFSVYALQIFVDIYHFPLLLSHLSAKLDVFSSSNLSLRVSPSSTHNSFLLALLWILSSLPALKTPQIINFLMWAGTKKMKINFLKREGFFWIQATGNR